MSCQKIRYLRLAPTKPPHGFTLAQYRVGDASQRSNDAPSSAPLHGVREDFLPVKRTSNIPLP
jgi:hypothetical protein